MSLFASLKSALERRAALEQLRRLSDEQLRDIGVERAAIGDLFRDPPVRAQARSAPVATPSRAFA